MSPLRMTIVFALIALLGLSIGLIANDDPKAVFPKRIEGLRMPSLERPGRSMAPVADYFAKLNPPPLPPPPPPPPQPDIGLIFRQQVRAVTKDNGQSVLLIERLGRIGRVHKGEVFQDGWVIAAIDAQQVELRKGAIHRKVGLFVKPQEFVSEPRS